MKKNRFILPKVPKDGKVFDQTVMKVADSDMFVALGSCIGKRAKRKRDSDGVGIPFQPTKKSDLLLDDDGLYESLAQKLVTVRMPMALKARTFRINEKITCKNSHYPSEVQTFEHLFLLFAKALMIRFRLTDGIMANRAETYKVLVNEHLGLYDKSEEGDCCESLPLEFKYHGPRYKNLCIACGMAGVVDFEEVCCDIHTGKAPKCDESKRRNMTKNSLPGGLCFYCTILQRLNHMTLINEDKGSARDAKSFCKCTNALNFSRMLLLAALSLNHGLFAPMILNKGISEMIENVK